MQKKNNQGSPFPYEWEGKTLYAKDVIQGIANWMRWLRKKGTIHRDLKASNDILLDTRISYPHIVVDFESLIGVTGTTF